MMTGTYTAIVTPLRNGRLDETALESLVRDQIRGGVDGIVPVGTTGESPTLDYEEHIRVIELAVQLGKGRLKVMAGTGANSTREAVELTQAAERAGADSSLQVCPYYNKPTQAGLVAHFKAIAQSTSLPLVLYSIPGRSVIEIAVDTVVKLASTCGNIRGIKEAGGSADRVSQLRQALGSKFSIFSGDDSQTLPFMSVGADGVISVASNVIPKQIARMVRAAASGDFKAAMKLHFKYYPLFKNLFIETSPGPVKAALAMMGKCREEYRLPLVGISQANRTQLRGTLRRLNLIK